MTRVQRNLKREIGRLRQLYDDIKSLRDFYTSRIKETREELSFRSNENITSFTYVTVVFLPLGFSASLFSMNGSPAGPLVASMVTCSVVALAVTTFALLHARVLTSIGEDVAGVVHRFTEAVHGFTETAMKHSAMVQGKQERKYREMNTTHNLDSRDGNRDERGGNESRTFSTSSFAAFWLSYLFIELPARRIVLAYRILASVPQLHEGILTVTARVLGIRMKPRRSSWKAIIHTANNILCVVGGLMLLPVLLISWLCQILLYNLFDILSLIGGECKPT